MTLLYAILGLLHLILFLRALVKILGSSSSPLAKVMWLLIVLIFPLGGLILHLLIGTRSDAGFSQKSGIAPWRRPESFATGAKSKILGGWA